MQATVRNAIEFRGQGLHSGRPARLRILPASGNYGIWFKRVDVPDRLLQASAVGRYLTV